MAIETLKRRAEFLRTRGGGRASTQAFVIEGKVRTERVEAGPRFGFTVTKKIGNAVVRNRIRRRLKAAIAELPSGRTRAGFDYVIIARDAALDRPFAQLKTDLDGAFVRVHDAKRQTGPQQQRRK